MSKRGLQVVLGALGVVALVAGTSSVIGGSAAILGSGGVAAPSVDSELRFYAAWYALAGVFLVAAARHPEEAGVTVRAVGAAFFIAACGRTLSLVVVGRPHALAIVLMVVEFAIPAVIVPWQRAVARSGR